MKMKIYMIALAMVAGGLLSSCDTDNESTIYTPQNVNVSFETEEPAEVLTANASDTIAVRIVRSDTRSAYTAHYTMESADNGIFTENGGGTVTFEPGEGVKVIDVIASNMKPGNSYSATLTLSDADLAVADTITNNMKASTTLTVRRDYTWVAAGSGTFDDETFIGATATVKVEHAQDTKLYRLVNPYQAIAATAAGADLGKVQAANLQFTMEDDGTVSMDDGTYEIVPGSTQSASKMYWAPTKYPDYCNVTNDKGVITWNFLVLNGSDLYTGGNFIFTWTDGYPIK